jgi:hypothetical protein
MKKFIGKKLTKKVEFMDGEVEVRVLTVGDIRAIEAKSKELGEEADQLEVLRFVLRMAVVDAEELTDEEFDGFPVTELTKLSESIMGMSHGAAEAGNA